MAELPVTHPALYESAEAEIQLLRSALAATTSKHRQEAATAFGNGDGSVRPHPGQTRDNYASLVVLCELV